jgi:aspartate/methionine/tyrosine aminotransferase
MNFSKRTKWNTEENELARAVRERVAAGLKVADLTASNPTRCGFDYPADLLEPLGKPGALVYDPKPMGSLEARQAVSLYYTQLGAEIAPEKILLTTSTSEAYGYLFKLLLDSGESILVPQPSYPLFDFLARTESIEIVPVALIYDHGWELDLGELRRQITATTRAVVLVHPNNPTGNFIQATQAVELAAICRDHCMALIVDEVFLDYGLGMAVGDEPLDRITFAARKLDCLIFIVSGISKICGLPQMKVAWLAAVGPGSDEALARLEVVADSYLSMNTPVQLALPVWLDRKGAIQRQIRERVGANLRELDKLLAESAGGEGAGGLVTRLKIEGGWYVVLRVPATQGDEPTCWELLEEGVLIHPGYFFGMAQSGWLVASLLTPAVDFSRGISMLLEYFQRKHESYF